MTEPALDADARRLAVLAAQFADDRHGSDIVVLAVGEVLSVAEYFVIVSASNRRLVGALVDEIEAKCREATGRSPLRVEGVREQQWVLLDYGDVVIHVFLDETRDFYEIERLYTDVARVEWRREGAAGPGPADPDEGA